MKKIKVLFFGSISEASGRTEEFVELEGNLDELTGLIKEKYPSLIEIRHSLAVNQEIMTGDARLNDGDEVAFLPPFAGG